MRIKIFILLLWLHLIFNFSFSQDTNIIKYLPLKIGNAWIYDWLGNGNSGNVKLKITSSVQFNNHTYYYFEQTGNPCVCAQYSHSPFLIQLDNPIRIDSVTGNIFWKFESCAWHFEEKLYDSLKMIPSNFVNNACFFVSVQDTNNVTVFGNNTKSKNAGEPVPTYYKFRRYAQNFGLISSVQGCSFSTLCTYSLKGCVVNGVAYGDTAFLVGINQISTEIPNKFSLFQNYPNPFNPMTNVKFQIPNSGFVKLIVYDLLGKEIQTLVNKQLSPGTYEVDFEGSNLPSGVYYYKFESGAFTETKKMVLVK